MFKGHAEIITSLRDTRDMTWPVLLCFYTGAMPQYAAAMPRDPQPPTGLAFDDGFPALMERALAENPAIHDGAVMIGRSKSGEEYRVSGWSHRLFPPSILSSRTSNKGSAFNSCLAMSAVRGVDQLYLIGREALFVFKHGSVNSLEAR